MTIKLKCNIRIKISRGSNKKRFYMTENTTGYVGHKLPASQNTDEMTTENEKNLSYK